LPDYAIQQYKWKNYARAKVFIFIKSINTSFKKEGNRAVDLHGVSEPAVRNLAQ